MNTPLDLEKPAKLDGLFTNARCYLIRYDGQTKVESRNFEIENTQAAIDALKSPPPLVENIQADLILLNVSTTRSAFHGMQQNFQATFSHELPFERGEYTPLIHGILSIKDDGAIFETLMGSGSYMFLLLRKHGYAWQGCIIHDMGDGTLEAAMPSIEDMKRITQHCSVRGFARRNPPYSLIRCLMARLGRRYIKEIQKEVKDIEEQVERVNTAIKTAVTQNLSEFMLKLNNLSEDVRNLRLEHQTVFAFEVARTEDRCLVRSVGRNEDNEILQLQRMDYKSRTFYSAPLKESIADVRAQIADIAAQQHQEREELRWVKEQQLWKDREEAEQRRDQEKLEMQRKRQDAKDAYEKEKERLQTERESERFEQEKELRLYEIKRQRDRDAIEDQRAKDTEAIQRLSIMFAEESLRDSRTMRGIAWLTMAFLPATFVSSFFGMSFFNGVPGTSAFDEASRYVWMFFVVAVPISAIVLAGFWYWDRQTQAIVRKQREQRLKMG
jgi:Mg2+ and Co2+ transporter CorA